MTLYSYCLAIGLIALFLSLLLDGISDIFQGLSFFDIHFDFLPGILPFSPLQICAFLVGFGGIGMTFYTLVPLHWIPAVLSGLALSYGTKWLISKLRKVDSSSLTPLDLLGIEGTVIVTIFENGIGSVALNTKVGKISYAAKSDHLIKQGTTVKVVDFQTNLLIVSDASDYFL